MLKNFSQIVSALHGLKTPKEILALTGEILQKTYNFDRVYLKLPSENLDCLTTTNNQYNYYNSALSLLKDQFFYLGKQVNLPILLSDCEKASELAQLSKDLRQKNINSIAIFPLKNEKTILGWIEMHFCENYFRWRKEDYEYLNDFISIVQACLLQAISILPIITNRSVLKRVVDACPAMILELQTDGKISFCNQGVLHYLGERAEKVTDLNFEQFCTKFLTENSSQKVLKSFKAIINNLTDDPASQESNQTNLLSFVCEVVNQQTRQSSNLAIKLNRVANQNQTRISLIALELPQFSPNSTARDSVSSYERLVKFGNTLIVRADKNFIPTYIVGDSQSLLGLSHEQILDLGKAWWLKSINRDDLTRLSKKLKAYGAQAYEFNEEIRVTNQTTGATHWLVVRGAPLYSHDQELIGWEGFALDHTERRQAEEKFIKQDKRIEALYQVSKAIEFSLDARNVISQGLSVVEQATGSECSLGLTYDQTEEKFELLVSQGVSQEYINQVNERIKGKSLVRYCVQNKKGEILSNIQNDNRANIIAAKLENVKSTIVAPMIIEDAVVGVLVLYCRKEGHYSEEDLSLAMAAANQIGLALRQTHLYASVKRQAAALGALYRLSHELSQYLTQAEVVQQAFKILHEELACKRMWLGVLNEQKTHIVGQAGFGPGVRKPVIELQIELSLRHDYLDQAIRSKSPVIVPAGARPECSGLNRIIERFNLSSFVIVPLVTLGQVIGLVVIEPAISQGFFAESKLSLLSSMASEIAAVLLARRLEKQIAETEKMQMAGLFASGVAHNFNNMLQAVLGQASLISMQTPDNSPVASSAKMIIEAAQKAAGLVKQLLSFSSQELDQREDFIYDQWLKSSKELYQSLLGSGIELVLHDADAQIAIKANKGRLQQVLTNILLNARDAISTKSKQLQRVIGKQGQVSIFAENLNLKSNQIDPDLAPGNYLRISIKDNGVGMGPEQKKRCFEPFYTTKNIDQSSGVGVSGSGLGLSTAYSVVKQHGGIITVDSNLGEGSTFNLYIPIADQNSNSLLTQEKSKEKVIMLAFDNPEKISIKASIESFAHEVSLLPGTQNIREKISQIRPKLVIFDADGFGTEFTQILEELKIESPQTRFVACCTMYDKWATAMLGLGETIQKPVDLKSIHGLLLRSGLNSAIEVVKSSTKEDPISAAIRFSEINSSKVANDSSSGVGNESEEE